jgi:cytochrome P450
VFDSAFLRDPYPTYRRLRETAPIHWSPEFLGGAWLLPRYVDVMHVLSDVRFSSRRSNRLTGQFTVDQRIQLGEFDRIFGKWMLFMDQPEHSALRRRVNRGFKPAVLEAMRPRIEAIVQALLEKFDGASTIDFMRDFAHPLPALVIADMLAVDPDDQNDFVRWADDIAAFIGNPHSSFETALQAQASLVALTGYFRALLSERRRDRGGDLVSLLIEEDGDIADDDDILAQCSLLLFAGHETTRNLLGNGLLALLSYPEQWAILISQPSLVRDAVRELLRYDSPVQFIRRRVCEDMALHGAQIQAGQDIVSLVASANRDPEQFTDPERLDIRRREKAHLAFGCGPHMCVGAALSYMEAEIAFKALLSTVPDVSLTGADPDWRHNMAFRGLRTLPLRLDGLSFPKSHM